jgi:hypothetical protein
MVLNKRRANAISEDIFVSLFMVRPLASRASMTLYAIALHAIVSRFNSSGLVEAGFAARLGRVFTRRGNEADSIR